MLKEILESNMIQYVPFIYEHYCRNNDPCFIRTTCCSGYNHECACGIIYMLYNGVIARNPFGWHLPRLRVDFDFLCSNARDFGFLMTGSGAHYDHDSMVQNAGRFETDILPYLVVKPNQRYESILRASSVSTSYQMPPWKSIVTVRHPDSPSSTSDDFDIVRFYNSELAARKAPAARRLLLCWRERVPDSPFHKDNLPLDMFKIIYYLVKLPYRDPLPRPMLERIRDAPRMRTAHSKSDDQ